jgi:ABC-2 type transport system permease protein
MNAYFRIKAIAFKELRQLSRDRLTFGMIVMIPLIQLILFGYAINTDIRHINVGLVDQSHNQMGRLIEETARASQVVNFKYSYHTAEEARNAIQSGKIRAALVIPADVNQRFEQGRELGQWMVDGSDSAVSATILGLVKMPFTPDEKQPNQQVSNNSTGKTFEATVFYNPSRKSAVNIVPGLLGVILTMTMVLFTSIAIVRERERGNLELLITTPVTPIELMIAKIIPYIFVGLVQVVIVLGLGHLLFSVPINGSVVQIFWGSLLFIAASLTLGLMISAVADNQLQSMQLTMFILLPSIMLSGFMFPFEGMPQVAQWIAEALPATHYMRIIRGVVVRGAELKDMSYDSLWLAAFTVLGIFVAATRFKKSLD